MCTLACTDTYTHAHVHTRADMPRYIHTYIPTYTHKCRHIQTDTCIHTHIHPSIHPSVRPSIHACMHACMHVGTDACNMYKMYIYMYMYIHIYGYRRDGCGACAFATNYFQWFCMFLSIYIHTSTYTPYIQNIHTHIHPWSSMHAYLLRTYMPTYVCAHAYIHGV